MFATLLSVTLFVSLAVQGVLADFHVETPTLVQCQSVNIKWARTTGPYSLFVVKSTDPCGDILVDLGNQPNNTFNWKVDLPADLKLMFSVENAAGDEGWSKEMIVQPSSDSSCVRPGFKAATSTTSSSTDPSPVPLGAANAGKLPFSGGSASGALAMRQLNTPAMALSALVAAAAVFAL